MTEEKDPKAAAEPTKAQAWLQTAAFVAGVGILAWKAPYLLAAIAFLSLLIFVHELGHFTVAKWQGMRIDAFSIGMGPALIKIRRGGTDYQIAAIPVGGYVKLAGEQPETDEQIFQAKPDEFMGKPWWSRAMVVLAGPVTNLVFPVLALFLVYVTIGRSYPWGPPMVEEIMDKSGALEAGMKPADLIIRINGQQVSSTLLLSDLVDKLSRQDLNVPLKVELLRQGKPLTVNVKTQMNSPSGKYLMGIKVRPSLPPFSTTVENVVVISPAERAGLKKGDQVVSVGGKPLRDGFEFASLFAGASTDPVEIIVMRAAKSLTLTASKKQPIPEEFADPALVGLVGLDFEPAPVEGGPAKRDKLNFGQALRFAYSDTVFAAKAILLGLKETVLGHMKARDALGGPIAIMRMASQEAERGWEQLLQLMCNLSLTLGLMNLLPVPLLDGSTFLQCLIEGVRRKPLKLKTQTVLQNIGLTLLISLFAFTMVNDVLRWFHR